MPPTTPLPPEPPRASSHLGRYRTLYAWVAAVAVALLLIGAAGQWAAGREASFQADSIRRAMEVHALGLRDAAGKYGYLPRTAGMHPDVFGVLAHPRDPAAQQRANRYIEEVNRHAGSDALYLIDLEGLTLAASNWATPQSFVGESYANRSYFIDARAGRSGLFYGVGYFAVAVTAAVAATAKYTGAGMPSQSPPPTLARRAVVVVGIPAVYQSTAPNRRAFVPSVATIGLRRIRPTSHPLSNPAAMAARNAIPIAGQRRALSPAGYLVKITT